MLLKVVKMSKYNYDERLVSNCKKELKKTGTCYYFSEGTIHKELTAETTNALLIV